MNQQQLINEIRARDRLHTSGRAHEINSLEYRIAKYNKQHQRATRVTRLLLIEERRNAGMAELVDATVLSVGQLITGRSGSSPAPRTNLYNLKAIERARE